MIIPAKLYKPRVTIKPKGACIINKPKTAPINDNGIVKVITAACLNELNCATNKIKIKPKTIGMLAPNAF